MEPGFLKKIALLILTAATSVASAADPTLKVGDAAPKLQSVKWVQGEPVKEFEKGKAYLVEFWATWCPPCRDSIPHLNDLQAQFKDKGLVVIGQDCAERDDSLVAPFVEKMGAKMTYRVALDDKTRGSGGPMADTWMTPAGRNSIPTAFLVDKTGIIAWIGHPMELKENLIQQVLAANYDVRKAAEEYDQRAKNETRLQAVWAEFYATKRDKNWAAASASLAEAEKLMPAGNHSAVDMARFDLLLLKRRTIQLRTKWLPASVTRTKTTPRSKTKWPGALFPTRRSNTETWPWRRLSLLAPTRPQRATTWASSTPWLESSFCEGRRTLPSRRNKRRLNWLRAAKKRRCKRWSRATERVICLRWTEKHQAQTD